MRTQIQFFRQMMKTEFPKDDRTEIIGQMNQLEQALFREGLIYKRSDIDPGGAAGAPLHPLEQMRGAAGPSPPPPFQTHTNRTLSIPHASAEYSSHRLQRSKRVDTSRQRAKLVGMNRIADGSSVAFSAK